ncbi:GPI ethanolamine phosphate transferase 2-like [Pistacia vera]|uniref:GPI ethanolamine phosphate transferase 2-like n=1 Tax=Pistacia vera TaxID=55513 RepID=UPI001262F214|nr:GPI ethanolamine phosphate transferase 2-like [Pistacia vera]
MKAAVLHNSWKSKQVSESDRWEVYSSTFAAYHKFLKTASEWLSSRATDKPVNLLASGVAAMLLSCLIFLSLILRMCREVSLVEKQHHSELDSNSQRWHLDETFVLGVIFILVVSMTSSSMVEEEHYIWHFMASTLYLVLLRKTAQLLPAGSRVFRGQNIMSSVFVLLISGRILRGWHQGGVNWTYLPDISKWLEQGGNDLVKAVQLVSGVMAICVGLYALSFFGSKKIIVQVVGINFCIAGLLVLQYVMRYQDNTFVPSSDGATLLAQIIYAILGSATVGTVVVIPWLIPIHLSDMGSSHNIYLSTLVPRDIIEKSPLMEIRDSLYVIGWSYILCWCLLQLLLQQPINSMPLLLLLVQIMTSMLYFSYSCLHHKEWVEVSALCFLGMAGHFALGNSNTLATIDVAGAFIGISSHSTLLSGILMFSITYASPMLALLSMVVYMSVKSYLVVPQNVDSGHLLKTMLGFPCLVPLGINSILLTAYTIVLLLMRNHLFVWSVFSPKYLYVCATTVCIYTGVTIVAATGIYAYLVLVMRKMKRFSIFNH